MKFPTSAVVLAILGSSSLALAFAPKQHAGAAYNTALQGGYLDALMGGAAVPDDNDDNAELVTPPTAAAYLESLSSSSSSAVPRRGGIATTTSSSSTLAVGSQHYAVTVQDGHDKILSPRFRKKTKQLATLGPASCDFDMIEKLFLAGADVFRLNFSHGEHAQKLDLLTIIRAVEDKHDHPIAVLGDLQGPKLRVGQFANPAGEVLTKDQTFRLDLDATTLGTQHRVLLPHPEIIAASDIGHVLLIDDGKMKLRVTGKGPGYLDCTVEVPGLIKDKKVRTLPAVLFLMDGWMD